eukprot:Gb_34765 [translate_table: standard]
MLEVTHLLSIIFAPPESIITALDTFDFFGRRISFPNIPLQSTS